MGFILFEFFFLSEIIVAIVRIQSNAAVGTDNPTIANIIIAVCCTQAYAFPNWFIEQLNHRWNYCICPFGKNLEFNNFCPLKTYLKTNVSVVGKIEGNKKGTTKRQSH